MAPLADLLCLIIYPKVPAMIVVDAHQDIAYNSVNFGRDYRRSTMQTRKLEGPTAKSAMLGLPDAILGRVGVAFATLFVTPAKSAMPFTPEPGEKTYTTPQEAYKLALSQLDYYKRLADEDARLALITDKKSLDAVLSTWQDGKEITDRQQGLVILMEGADPIIEPQQFEEWYERGVRIVGPAWSQTRYAGGTGAPGPLTKLGYELLDVMADKKALLDLSHLAERAFLDAVERYEGPIIASHSNPRKFRNSDRHLSDEMILRLVERDGVMGIVMLNAFLDENWKRGDPKSHVPMSRVLDAIDYVCQLAGSAAHVGLGSDFDGGFGAESAPDGMDTVTDLWNIGAGLRERGYSEEDIRAILGGNMIRKLRQILP